MQVIEIIDNGKYFYVECLKSSLSYKVGSTTGCDFHAHSNHKYCTELTYLLPVGNLLFNKHLGPTNENA